MPMTWRKFSKSRTIKIVINKHKFIYKLRGFFKIKSKSDLVLCRQILSNCFFNTGSHFCWYSLKACSWVNKLWEQRLFLPCEHLLTVQRKKFRQGYFKRRIFRVCSVSGRPNPGLIKYQSRSGSATLFSTF
jgi:hypothetical protein